MWPKRVTVTENGKQTRYEIKHDGTVYEFCRATLCTVGMPLSEVSWGSQKSAAQKVREAAQRMS